MTALIVGDVHALVGRGDELVALLRETQEHARAEPGCDAYAFAEVVGEPGHYVVVQEWRDEEALEAHYASPAFRRYQDWAQRPSSGAPSHPSSPGPAPGTRTRALPGARSCRGRESLPHGEREAER